MDLRQAMARFQVAGIDTSALAGQEEAFRNCMRFLDGIEKTKRINTRHGSYGLKHMVENPTGRFGRRSDQSKYTGYVYEGTFVLAALASGFSTRRHAKSGLHYFFNISERSLKNKFLSL